MLLKLHNVIHTCNPCNYRQQQNVIKYLLIPVVLKFQLRINLTEILVLVVRTTASSVGHKKTYKIFLDEGRVIIVLS